MIAAKKPVVSNREFVLSDRDFETIRTIISERTGIVLSDGKRDMVYGRLVRRLRALGLSGFGEYCTLISKGDESELSEFVNAITTNLTAFFREKHHFDFLEKELLPFIMKHKQERKLRIWSAGCSSGEEPYSIAMVVRDTIPNDWDTKILATDLDTNMVDKASAGIYDEGRVSGIDEKRLRRWVKRGKGSTSGMIRMSDELRNMITFKQLNLMHDWPFKGQFDFIFCRNVVIYFSKDTQRILFNRFADSLPDGGHIFIGHSESMFNVCDRYKLLGKTIYKKTG
ncbi:MAG TPA: protein-glutamate O-methyltransferase CheR [Gammaproteobacteria bacterium]|nr:protein-glutamate O-methyltransferase CheR [Gammaproteobacteria bacterium]